MRAGMVFHTSLFNVHRWSAGVCYRPSTRPEIQSFPEVIYFTPCVLSSLIPFSSPRFVSWIPSPSYPLLRVIGLYIFGSLHGIPPSFPAVRLLSQYALRDYVVHQAPSVPHDRRKEYLSFFFFLWWVASFPPSRSLSLGRSVLRRPYPLRLVQPPGLAYLFWFRAVPFLLEEVLLDGVLFNIPSSGIRRGLFSQHLQS